MATERELQRIKELLAQIEATYSKLGKENPFRGYDTSKITNTTKATKQLEVALSGVQKELDGINDSFDDVFDTLQSITNELTKNRANLNAINSSTRTLNTITGKLKSFRAGIIDLDKKEIQGLQTKSDYAFANLQNQLKFSESRQKELEFTEKNLKKEQESLNAVKNKNKEQKDREKEVDRELKANGKQLETNQAALKNTQFILRDNLGIQDLINRKLLIADKEVTAINKSLGVTGTLFNKIAESAGLGDILGTTQSKKDVESLAQTLIEEFRNTDEYLAEKFSIEAALESSRDALSAFEEEASKIQSQIDVQLNLQKEGGEIDEEELQKLQSSQIEVEQKIAKVRKEGIEDNLDALDNLEERAINSLNTTENQFKLLGKNISSSFNNAIKTITSVEGILTVVATTLVKAFSSVNTQVVQLSKNLALSYDESQDLRSEFQGVANAADDTFISTKKLLEANAAFNQVLGLQGEIIAQNAENFVQLNKQLGIGIEEATQLQLIAESTGANFREQTLQQYETIQAVSKQFGVSLNVRQVMEEVGKAGAYALAQFGGSVTELTKATAQAKALGLELSDVNKIAGQLLDFETSITNELQAELLLGRDINLERARLAALNNDQITLMEELNREMGDFNDFSSMNRIQQEAMASAIGMSVEELSDALLLEQYRNKNQKEIAAEAGVEVAKRVEMLTTQERFTASVEKMQDLFISIVEGPIGDLAQGLSSILSSSTAMYGILGALAGGPLVRMITGFKALIPVLKAIRIQSIGAAIASIFSGNAKFGPLGIAAAGAGVAALYGAIKTSEADDMISPGYGKRMLFDEGELIALNDKDNVIATTNPIQTSNNIDKSINNEIVKEESKNTILKQTFNQFEKLITNEVTKELGSIQQPITQITNNELLPPPTENVINNYKTIEAAPTMSPNINVTPNVVVNTPQQQTQQTQVVDNSQDLKAIKNVLEKIAASEGSININGTKFGTVTAMNTYQIQ